MEMLAAAGTDAGRSAGRPGQPHGSPQPPPQRHWRHSSAADKGGGAEAGFGDSAATLSPPAAGVPGHAAALVSPPRKRHARPNANTNGTGFHRGPRIDAPALGAGWELSPAAEARLSADIEALYDSLLPPGDNVMRRFQFREKLQGIFDREYPGRDIRVHLFGSSISGLAASYSDVDVCIETPWDDRINGVANMFVLAGTLRRHGMSITQVVNSAKVPVCKFFDPEFGICCDANVNNTLSLKNTELVRSYVAIDPRVRKLCVVIKHWAKRRQLNDAAKGGTLSSYCWVMMIIHFLQTRNPPLLPCLHALYDGPPELSPEGVDTAFYTDIEELQLSGFSLRNGESLGGLLFRFFRRFAIEFDYETMVVSVRTGELLRKSEKGWDVDMARHNNFLAVEEPFDPRRNLANSADFYSVVGLRGEFRRAFEVLLGGGTLEQANARYVFPGDPPGSPNPDGVQLHLQLAGSLFPGKGYRSGAPTPKKANGAPPGEPQPPPTPPAERENGEHHARSASFAGIEFAVGKDGLPFVVQANPYHHISYRFVAPQPGELQFHPPHGLLAPDFSSMGAAQYVELAPYYQAAAAERQGRYLAVHADAGRRHSSVDRAARPAGQGMRGALRAQAMSETASPQWKPAADAERGAGSPPKEVEVLELALPATAQGPSPASESSYADSAEGDPESSSSGASRTPSPPPERQGKSPKAGGKPRRTLLWTNSSVRASTDMVMGAEELFTPRAPGERDRDRDGKAGEERKGKPAANGKPKANGAPPGKPQANGSAAPAKPQANGSAAPAKPHANGSGAKLQANGTAAAPARAGAAAKHRAASFGNSFASLEAPSSQPAAPARGEPVVRAMSWAAVVAKPTSREAAEREE